MKLSKRKRSTLISMNVTPMIDVVFLLIIFFMTVSQVSKINKERLELPKMKGTRDQVPSILTINVSRDGQVLVSGREVSVARLVLLVADELRRLGDKPHRLTIVVRADERGSSKTVNRIVTALAGLELTRIRIAVEVPQA